MRFLLIVLLALLGLTALAKEPSPRPASSHKAELDRAFDEFKTAAEHLGRTMGKAADENTVEVREKLMKTMSEMMLQLSHTMNKAAEHIETSREKKKDDR